MGTSRSGTGPGSGVALVPPWVPDPAAPADGDDGSQEEQPPPVAQPVPLAPRARFGPARSSLGRFGRAAGSDEMRRGIGHYVRKGLGGAGVGARRMEGTARTAGTLFGALSLATAGQAAAPGSLFDPALLAGRSANEVVDALVEAVRPSDGTQDGEASRSAIGNALAEFLNRFPQANLLDLSEDQRLFVIECYMALDVYNRFALDLGKVLQDKAPSASDALARLKDVREYIKQIVSASFRALRKVGEVLTVGRVADMARRALRESFEVFEEYVQ